MSILVQDNFFCNSADTVPTTQGVAQSQDELVELDPAWGVLYSIDINVYPIGWFA